MAQRHSSDEMSFHTLLFFFEFSSISREFKFEVQLYE